MKSDSIMKSYESQYGAKSAYTLWLESSGYDIPKSCYLDVEMVNSFQLLKDSLKEFLLSLKENEEGLYGVAIRSSAIGEDGMDESFAGHLLSFVGDYSFDDIINLILEIVADAKANGLRSGVLVQEKIEAAYSGVIFSSHPITSNKSEIPLLIGKGLGMGLVSGTSQGEDIVVSYESNSFQIPNLGIDIAEEKIIDLCSIVKKIEDQLIFPVDVEWCINGNGKIYILQCRPITSITSIKNGVISIEESNKSQIPDELIRNDKVKIRFIAEKYGVHISKAFIVSSNGNYYINNKDLTIIPEKNDGSGYSVVLLYPSTIDGKILRQFASDEKDRQNLAYRKCQRYSLRTFQGKKTLCGAIQAIQLECLNVTWKNYIIIQEIYNASYTGIIKKFDSGIAIEIARGHFVPKGLVPTSNYVLNERSGKVLHKNEIRQKYKYEIQSGKVNRVDWDELIHIDELELQNIWKSLKTIVTATNNAIEFGIRIVNGKSEVYLIDLVEDKSEVQLSSDDISNGVISPGNREGRLSIIDNVNFIDAVDLHFHDQHEESNTNSDRIIFLADMPDISLLKLINDHQSENIGFIFKHGSTLSHLSIILREKKIPAVVMNKTLNLESNSMVKIDTYQKTKIELS